MRKRDNSDLIRNPCRNSEKLGFRAVNQGRKEELKLAASFVDAPEWKPESILRHFSVLCLPEP